MKSDWIAVMDITGCLIFFVVLCTYIRANAYCHLIGRDDENTLSLYIDQSDDTIHLLQYTLYAHKAIKMAKYSVVSVTTVQSHFI